MRISASNAFVDLTAESIGVDVVCLLNLQSARGEPLWNPACLYCASFNCRRIRISHLAQEQLVASILMGTDREEGALCLEGQQLRDKQHPGYCAGVAAANQDLITLDED